jgi:hypothetical protein
VLFRSRTATSTVVLQERRGLDPDVADEALVAEAPPKPDMAPSTSWWSVAIAAGVVAGGALIALAYALVRRCLKQRRQDGGN